MAEQLVVGLAAEQTPESKFLLLVPHPNSSDSNFTLGVSSHSNSLLILGVAIDSDPSIDPFGMSPDSGFDLWYDF